MHNNDAGDGAGRKVEVEANTVEEAIVRGLVRLGGLSREEVDIEVLSEGGRGILGFGGGSARVRLTTKGGAAQATHVEPVKDEEMPATGVPPVDPGERMAAADQAAQITRELLEHMGFGAVRIEIHEVAVPGVDGPPPLSLDLTADGLERLLADQGQPLRALQFIVRLIVSRRTSLWLDLLLDVEGQRQKRISELAELAKQVADEVVKQGRPMSMQPMTSFDRRVVHLALRDHPEVISQSIGSGETRKVTVRLKQQALPRHGQ
jgi:spoIIIJ-associated protein